jgi:magnesium chelatase subunit D
VRQSGHRLPLTINPNDLQRQVRARKPQRLILFVVDTSDSMGDGPEGRMAAALGAATSLAKEAYLKRDQVGLITFRERTAQLLVPPTDSVVLVRRRLQRLPIGGATPLAAGLLKAWEVVGQAQCRNPELAPLLVLISDGDATAPLNAGGNPAEDCLIIADRLRRMELKIVLIDTQTSGKGGIMPKLAALFDTNCHHLHHMRPKQILRLIEQTEH